MPETEIDAQIGHGSPGDQPRRREDTLVVRRENRREKHREQAGDAQEDALEQVQIAGALAVGRGRRQIQPRHRGRSQFHDEGDGGPRLNRDAVDVREVEILIAFRAETEGRRDVADARRVEVRPDHARPDELIALRGEPARDRLVGGIAEREDDPTRVRSRRLGGDGHAARDAVRARRRLDAELVAALLVKLAQEGDVDLVLVWADDDGFERGRAPGHAHGRREQHKAEQQEHAP